MCVRVRVCVCVTGLQDSKTLLIAYQRETINNNDALCFLLRVHPCGELGREYGKKQLFSEVVHEYFKQTLHIATRRQQQLEISKA